jgi:DNA polymerase family A
MRPLAEDGSAVGPAESTPDLAAAVTERARHTDVRWVWPSSAALYPALLRMGVRVTRCHDIQLTERLLASRDGGIYAAAALAGAGDYGSVAHGGGAGGDRSAVRDRSTGRDRSPFGAAAVTRLVSAVPLAGAAGEQPGQLPFEDSDGTTPDRPPAEVLADVIAAHASQQHRIAADPLAARFALLAAAESAGGLAAAEMTAAGLPWRADVHDQILTEMLGPRPAAGPGMPARPALLAELTVQISAALGAVRPVNPDSPTQLLRALAAGGIRVPSTRTAVLRTVDHPVIPLLLKYKELARLYAANGWTWIDAWVADGRFRPEYIVGGVVSGRWATRGGGALQIPKVLRRAVLADPGWVLVVADAAQLEPRILAALAGDRSFAQAAAGGDVYAAVAGALRVERDRAKIALLSAMYGGTGGDGGQSLALLRRQFPQASAFVEAAARAGEEGRIVRSVLGRTCPPPSADWVSLTAESGDPDSERDPGAGRALRARGRFTRNFVVQASAADWALVLLAALRTSLAGLGDPGERPELVFFQHDEVLVHCPAGLAGDVIAAVTAAAASATRLVFGATPVTFPMTVAAVERYSDAK